MPPITYQDGIAIWKLIYYTPALVGTIWVSCRHGLSKNSGWILLAIFSMLRIISSCVQLATISSENDNAETIALVTGSLDLSPLLLASLGILSRVHNTILKSPWNIIFSLVILKMVQTPAAIALVICIMGATKVNILAEISTQPLYRPGLVLFLVVFIALFTITVGATNGRRITQRGEIMLFLVVGVSLPLFLIRITYPLIFSFSSEKTFASTTAAELFLVTIEEMIITFVFLWAGLLISNTPADIKTVSEKIAHRVRGEDFSGERLGLVSLGAAVLSTVVEDRSVHEKTMDKDGKTVRVCGVIS